MYLSSGPIIRGASRKGLLVRPRQQRETKSTPGKSHIISKMNMKTRNSTIERKINELQREENEVKEKYQKAQELEKSFSDQINQLELQVEKIQRDLQWHQDQKIRNQSDIDNEMVEQENLKAEMVKVQTNLQELQGELDHKTSELDALPLDELLAQNAYWNTNTAVIEQALLDARNHQQEKINLRSTVGK